MWHVTNCYFYTLAFVCMKMHGYPLFFTRCWWNIKGCSYERKCISLMPFMKMWGHAWDALNTNVSLHILWHTSDPSCGTVSLLLTLRLTLLTGFKGQSGSGDNWWEDPSEGGPRAVAPPGTGHAQPTPNRFLPAHQLRRVYPETDARWAQRWAVWSTLNETEIWIKKRKSSLVFLDSALAISLNLKSSQYSIFF